MRKVVDDKTVGDFRLTIFDDKSGRLDFLAPGTIRSINMDRPQTNANTNVFYLATCEVKIGEGTQVGTAIIWEKQLNHPTVGELFKVGCNVQVAIQAKGEYKGNASVELPSGNKFDASLIDELTANLDMSVFADIMKDTAFTLEA